MPRWCARLARHVCCCSCVRLHLSAATSPSSPHHSTLILTLTFILSFFSFSSRAYCDPPPTRTLLSTHPSTHTSLAPTHIPPSLHTHPFPPHASPFPPHLPSLHTSPFPPHLPCLPTHTLPSTHTHTPGPPGAQSRRARSVPVRLHRVLGRGPHPRPGRPRGMGHGHPDGYGGSADLIRAFR